MPGEHLKAFHYPVALSNLYHNYGLSMLQRCFLPVAFDRGILPWIGAKWTRFDVYPLRSELNLLANDTFMCPIHSGQYQYFDMMFL